MHSISDVKTLTESRPTMDEHAKVATAVKALCYFRHAKVATTVKALCYFRHDMAPLIYALQGIWLHQCCRHSKFHQCCRAMAARPLALKTTRHSKFHQCCSAMATQLLALKTTRYSKLAGPCEQHQQALARASNIITLDACSHHSTRQAPGTQPMHLSDGTLITRVCPHASELKSSFC